MEISRDALLGHNLAGSYIGLEDRSHRGKIFPFTPVSIQTVEPPPFHILSYGYCEVFPRW